MKKIKKQSKKQLKQQISKLLNQIYLKLEQNSLVNIQPSLNFQNEKGLKNITREKTKNFAPITSDFSATSSEVSKKTPQKNQQEVSQKNQDLIVSSKLNLNYPLKAKIQKFNHEISKFDAKAIVGIYNGYVVSKPEFKDYSVSYKNLFAKLVLTFKKIA